MSAAQATMPIELAPIGIVRGGRTEVSDDDWGGVVASIEIDPARFDESATAGLDTFSHLVVVFHFHRVDPARVVSSARHPRSNPQWPKVGILAQRGSKRPNRLGVSTCRILGVAGLTIRVQGLDAIDGTPVLDVKPHMAGFDPRGDTGEPAWAQEIMTGYW